MVAKDNINLVEEGTGKKTSKMPPPLNQCIHSSKKTPLLVKGQRLTSDAPSEQAKADEPSTVKISDHKKQVVYISSRIH